jgi:hypothetical protein
MADSDERHYLIPHDAERDRLFGTALLNKDFSALLDHLNTNRLVAFIDACHAGAVGLQNIRGESAVYDSRRELGEGRGRYIIRSCGPDQKSYEGKENGIFTGHLLDLLKGSTEDFDKEEIDTFDLYRVLKDKVRKTAFELYKKEQEPDSEMASATGIVLAINRRLQKKRQDETAQAVARKSVFLDKVIEGIKRSAEAAGQKIIITQKLRDYVDEGQISSKFEQFYEMFDEYVGQNNEGLVDECSVQLVRLHSRILRSSDSPLKPAAATTTSQNGFVAPGEKKTTDSSNPPTPPPIPTIPRVAGEARRQFSSDDSNYILAEIFGSIELYRKARPLVELLSQPVTEAEVVMTIHRLIEDKTLQDPLDTIVTRFQERWPRAESKPAADISDKATVLLGRSLAARKTDNS